MCKHPGRWASTIALVGIATGTSISGYHWWQKHKPKPRELGQKREVEVSKDDPGLSRLIEGTIVPDALTLRFSKATAKLEWVTKPNPPGITMTPEHPGRWVWETDSRLSFKPSADWPPSKQFNITLDSSLLPSEVRLKDKPRWSFTTRVFEAFWSKSDYYTNPKEPEVHEITAELKLTHPMPLAEVEKNIQVGALNGGDLFDTSSKLFTLTPDADGAQRHYYLRTARTKMPEKEDFARLTFAKGSVCALGGPGTKEEATTKVRVPDVYSGFEITGLSTQLINTSEGEPEQFLFIDTSGYATPEEIAKNATAWFLPSQFSITNVPIWTPQGELSAPYSSALHTVKLAPVETEKDEEAPMATRHGFKFLQEQPGRLLVQVKRGTKAVGGFILGRNKAEQVDVPSFPKEVEVLGEGGILALNGERKLSFKSRGVKHLRLTLARLPSSQINHLAVLNNGTFEQPELYDLNEQNLAHFHREIITVAAKNDYQAVYSSFDFSAALKQEDKADLDASRGMFFLRIEGVKPRTKDDGDEESEDADPMFAKWQSVGDAEARRFILITDLGIIAKVNADKSREIFVQSVSKGEPLANTEIKVLAKNGEFIAEAITDAQGHASLPSLEGFRREKMPAAITARMGNDLAFMPVKARDRRMETSRFDTEGLVNSELKTLAAFVFTERGVYRPDDEIHVSGIVRRFDWGGELKGLPLHIAVFDAKDNELKTANINLAADGFFDWKTSTAESDPTGVYQVHVSRILRENEYEQIGRVGFRVEDFQPDRMKMSAKLNTKSGLAWIEPKAVKGLVHLETLFGTAAANRRIAAKLDLSPASFDFEGFPGFVFHNRKAYEFKKGADEDESGAGKKVDLGELKTNDRGEAEFDLQLERFDGGSFAMRFSAEGFEADGGRSVQAATSVLVSSMPYVVGYNAPSHLDYIGQDTPLALKFICLGPDAKPMAAPALKARVIRARYVSVLTKQKNGNYEYVSTRRESVASEQPFALPAGGNELTLSTNKAGEYRVELVDGEVIVSSCAFTIVGKGDPSRSLERDAELELKLARADWNNGDSIEMNLNAPYTGAGLITVEREKVMSWQWFKSPTVSSTQRILMPPGIEETGYVSVAYVRALDSPEIFTSPLSYSLAPFTANKEAHKLAVHLSAIDRVKPGEALHINYSTELPGRVVIFAVDEGIHQITNYKLPQPLTRFLPKRAHEVDTYQLLDLILPEFSMVAKQSAYGGDGDDALRVNLNPFKRKKDAPVVFWSGLVESGPQQREVVYNVPDYFDGRLKIMAVAVTSIKLGSAETQSLVRGPMVLTPNVPTFAAPGDEFTVSLSVANNMESGSEVNLKFDVSEQLELLDPAELKLAVQPGKEETTRVHVRARDVLGGATINFTASAGSEVVTRKATLSVRPAAPYLTDVQSGYFRLDKQDVKLERTVYPHFRKAEAVVSALPLGLARGLEAYLADYPHGCSEQITSRAMSRLLLMSEIDFGFDQAESSSQIQSALRQLVMRQNSDGGFGYWGGYSTTDNLSVYVTHFLTEAKEANHTLPSAMMDAALNRMKQIARGPRTDPDEQAAAIYLLTRNGQVTTNYLLNLRDTLEKQQKGKWQSTLAGAYIASTYALLQKQSEGDKLMRAWWASCDKKPKLERWYYGWFDEPQVKQSQGFALLCRHFPDIAKGFGFDEIAMITEPIRANHFNTYSAAYGVLALKAFSKVAQQANLKLSMQALTAAEPLPLASNGSGVQRSKFDAGLKGIRFLLDKNGSDLGAYYQVSESGFDKTPPTKVIADGLEVSRDLFDASGKPLGELKVGEVAMVTIRVRNNSPEALNDVAVLDMLPGGFMLAPNGLKPGKGEAGADYLDVREDRAVFFTHLGKAESKTFTYGIKPVCAGKFAVPPVFAECMYDRGVKGRAGGGSVEVK